MRATAGAATSGWGASRVYARHSSGRFASSTAALRPSLPLRYPAAHAATASISQPIQHAEEEVNAGGQPDPDASRGPKLRPYQEECLASILSALERGGTKLGVSSPTGSGKTTIFSELITQIPKPRSHQHRVLILVSSIQLALQTAQHVARRYPSLWVEVEQGARYKASGLADVTIATWQTLISFEGADDGLGRRRRVEKFDPKTFKAVIVDEAHHAASKSWRVVLNHFDPSIRVEDSEEATTPDDKSTNTPIIGFSATFSRHDGLSLGSVFDEIVFHRDVLDLIDEEW